MPAQRLRTFLALLLIATTALTFLIVGGTILAYRIPQINDDARDEVQTVAGEKARLLEFYLGSIESELRPLLMLAETVPPQALSLAAQSLAGRSERYLALYIADERGIVRAGGIPAGGRSTASVAGIDISRTALFTDIGKRGVAWSEKHLSVLSGDVVVAVALRRGRHTVVAELASDTLRHTVNTIAGETRDRLLVVDRRGEWIADTTRQPPPSANLGGTPVVAAALAGRAGGRIVDAGSEGSFFVGAAQPQTLGWMFIATRPAGLANPNIRRTVLLIGIGFAISVAVGLLISPFWARALARPLQRLIDRTHRLAEGRYDMAATPPGPISELNQLAEDLHLMSEAIREREASLARSEERLRATLENSPAVAVQWYDRDGICRYWNPASTAMYGYSAEETVGRDLAARGQSRANQEAFVRIIREIENSGKAKPSAEFTARHKDGRELTLLCSIFAIPDASGGQQFVCLDIDISERKCAESALLASRKELESIFNASPVPMSVSDLASGCRVIKINEAWSRQFGHSPEAVVGHTGQEIDLYADPADRDELVRRFARGPGIYDNLELWLKRADGSRLLCRISSRVIEVGGQLLMLMASEDITEERRMAAELRNTNEELEARVLQRTAALSEANEELATALGNLKQAQGQIIQSEKLAALGRLVAGIAHELNTPIGNGLMAVSTLESHQQEFREALGTNLRRSTLEAFVDNVGTATAIATRNLERAAELVASFKQVAADQTSSQRRSFDLKTVVDGVLTTLQPMISRSGQRVVTDIAANLQLDSFPGPLGQVLNNLIENSLRHAFDGRSDGRIDIRGSDAGDSVVLTLADDGCGIAAEYLPRIFDPFFTTKLGQGGSGLGLNIVHNLVTGTLGGHIEAASTQGQGTTLTLTLPKVAPGAATET